MAWRADVRLARHDGATVHAAALASYVRHGDVVLGFLSRALCCLFSVGGGLGQELLEVFEEVWRSLEEMRDLRIDVLYGFGLALVGLEDFEELLVDVWV